MEFVLPQQLRQPYVMFNRFKTPLKTYDGGSLYSATICRLERRKTTPTLRYLGPLSV